MKARNRFRTSESNPTTAQGLINSITHPYFGVFRPGEVVWHWGHWHEPMPNPEGHFGLSISICTNLTESPWGNRNFVMYKYLTPKDLGYCEATPEPPPTVAFHLMAASAIFNNCHKGGKLTMEVKDGLDALQRAELVPDDTYDMRIVKIRDERPKDGQDPATFQPSWSIASCEIVKAEDPMCDVDQVIGRRLDYWLIGQGGHRGLTVLLLHKHQSDPDGGWDQGIPADMNGDRDTKNLVGVEFRARVGSYEGQKGGYRQSIRPLTS